MNSSFRYFLFAFVCLPSFTFGQTSAGSVAAGQSPSVAAQPGTSQAVGSSPAAATVEMPSDPAALLALAAKRNGLQNVISSPWHLKATYEVLDEKGQPEDKGVYEEFWISEDKYRSSYSSAAFNQVSIVNEKGLYRTGDLGTPRGPGSLVKSMLLHGVSPPLDKSKVHLRIDERTVGSIKLKCVTVETETLAANPSTTVECFDDRLPALRISTRAYGLLQTLYQEVFLFEGVYIARTVELRSGSKTILRVRIDTLETYQTADEALFSTPAGATYVPRSVTAPSTVAGANIIKKAPPQYPASAKQQGIRGVVVLHAIITPEGKVSTVEPIIGPTELIRSATAAVKQWEYRPYLLNGVPVEVETEINVVFMLGR